MSFFFALAFSAFVTAAHADDGWCILTRYQNERAVFIGSVTAQIQFSSGRNDGIFSVVTGRVVIMSHSPADFLPALLITDRSNDEMVEVSGMKTRLGRWDKTRIIWTEAKCREGIARRKVNRILRLAYQELIDTFS